MFNDLTQEVLEVMHELEVRDAQDRDDGTPHLKRLRQITPDTGRFIALWAAAAPDGAMIEIGTSAGYSALWLAQACRARGRTLTTFEILPDKAALARATFARTEVSDVVRLVEGNFLDHADDFGDVGFCFRRKPVLNELLRLRFLRSRLGQSVQDFFGENRGEMGQGYRLLRCIDYGFQFGF